MSKQTCPKCGCREFVVSVIPPWMPNAGTYTRCPTCDKPQPASQVLTLHLNNKSKTKKVPNK